MPAENWTNSEKQAWSLDAKNKNAEATKINPCGCRSFAYRNKRTLIVETDYCSLHEKDGAEGKHRLLQWATKKTKQKGITSISDEVVES